MKKPWHQVDPGLFERIKDEIEKEYPDLRVAIEREVVFVRGSFPVRDGAEVLDRFMIEVQFPRDFPHAIPVVREIGGRIPWHEDRHVNRTGPQAGETCPIVPEEWLVRPDRDSISGFLAGPVRNFFLGQILVEQGKPWPFGERKHGFDGLFEAYGEMLGVTEPLVICRYLECLSHEHLKGHWECPCGSEKRLRACHIESIRMLQQKIPPWVAKQALERIKAYLLKS